MKRATRQVQRSLQHTIRAVLDQHEAIFSRHCVPLGHPTMPAGVENVAAFEAQLVAQVVDSLAMYMMDNARFMAERLHAEFPKEVTISVSFRV